MALKPNVPSQINSQIGLARPGGAGAKIVKPPVMKGTPGSSFAAMESSLLKGLSPNPKSLSGGGSGRQFYNQASGGDLAAGLAKVPGKFSTKPKKIKY
jgi:hypothetical protein